MKTKCFFLSIILITFFVSCKKDEKKDNTDINCNLYGKFDMSNPSDTLKYKFDSSKRVISDGRKSYIYTGNEVFIENLEFIKGPSKVVLNSNGFPINAIFSGTDLILNAVYSSNGNLNGITCNYSYTSSTSQAVTSYNEFIDNIIYDNSGNITSMKINFEQSTNGGNPSIYSVNVSFEYYLDEEIKTSFDPLQKIYGLTGYEFDYYGRGLDGYNLYSIQAFSKNLIKKIVSEDDNFNWQETKNFTYEFDNNGNVVTITTSTDNYVSQERFIYDCK